MQPLTNQQWGFDSNCFVCEPANSRGLRIPFHHDEATGAVVAVFTLDSAFSGAPSYIHGGVTLAILDEAMAWAAIAIGGQFALTRTMTAAFDHPVRVDRTYRVEARVTAQAADRIDATGLILDHKGRACVSARAEFSPIGAAKAAEATGAEVTGMAADHLAPPPA